MPYGNIALLNLHQYANLGQQTLVKISKYFEIYSFKSYSFVQACTNPATPAAIKWLNQLKKSPMDIYLLNVNNELLKANKRDTKQIGVMTLF